MNAEMIRARRNVGERLLFPFHRVAQRIAGDGGGVVAREAAHAPSLIVSTHAHFRARSTRFGVDGDRLSRLVSSIGLSVTFLCSSGVSRSLITSRPGGRGEAGRAAARHADSLRR